MSEVSWGYVWGMFDICVMVTLGYVGGIFKNLWVYKGVCLEHLRGVRGILGYVKIMLGYVGSILGVCCLYVGGIQ